MPDNSVDAAREREEWLQSLRALMGHSCAGPLIRRFITQSEASTFAGQSNQTIFNCGVRESAVGIVREMKEADIELFQKIERGMVK